MVRNTRGVRRAGWIAVAVCALGVHLSAGTDAVWPKAHEYTAVAPLVAAAQDEAMPLDRLISAGPSVGPDAGDTVVLLVVLDERVRQTQWLVQLRGPVRVEAAGSERAGRDTVLYAMDGREIRFAARRETYEVVTLGPVRSDRPDAAVPRHREEVAMNASFLDEAFERAAQFMLRTGLARREGRIGPDELFSVLPSRPRKPDAAARERFVTEVGLTEADERSIAATVPMLSEFARIMAETPGLREVLFSVMEKPSLWSIVSRFGRLEADFRFRSSEVGVSTGSPLGFEGAGVCYVVPFDFIVNGTRTLDCTTLVARGHPPLRLCGGVVAVVASSPEKPDVRLVARVIAARPGASGP